MSVTVKSLKKENDSLKNQIEVLTKDFKNLEEGLTKKFHQQQKSTTGNGREPAVDAETEKHLDFYSKSSDDLSRFKADAISQLQQQQKSRLNALSVQVEAIASAIEESQRYNYRYNVKITGIPDRKPSESAIETTAIYVKLFKKLGIEVSERDIDIAHRVPTRNTRVGPNL
jgi:chaperonin cofactor prefoldin